MPIRKRDIILASPIGRMDTLYLNIFADDVSGIYYYDVEISNVTPGGKNILISYHDRDFLGAMHVYGIILELFSFSDQLLFRPATSRTPQDYTMTTDTSTDTSTKTITKNTVIASTIVLFAGSPNEIVHNIRMLETINTNIPLIQNYYTIEYKADTPGNPGTYVQISTHSNNYLEALETYHDFSVIVSNSSPFRFRP
jgi:hypothetical protein